MNQLKMASTNKTWPLAPNGIFHTIQGEGSLMGVPMVFVRLAGCSVGCENCDTNYSVSRRVTADDVVREVAAIRGKSEWVWITGGEPTDHDVCPIIYRLQSAGLQVALATAGTREVPYAVDFLSVSPHSLVDDWVQRDGNQVNVVPGLNGLTLADVVAADSAGLFDGFVHRFLTPMADREGRPEKLRECVEFLSSRNGWRLGCQAHKLWGVP